MSALPDLQVLLVSPPDQDGRVLTGVRLALAAAAAGQRVTVWLSGKAAVLAEVDPAGSDARIGPLAECRAALSELRALGAAIELCSCAPALCGLDARQPAPDWPAVGMTTVAIRATSVPTLTF